MARKRRRHRKNSPRKRHRRRHYARNAPRGRRRRHYGRRRYRSNPPSRRNLFSVKALMDGATDAVEVVVGKAGARAIPSLVGVSTSGALGLAIQVAAAVVMGFIGNQFSGNMGKMFLAGGLAAPIESFIKGANIPILSPALGDGDFYAPGAYATGAGSYPYALPGVSAYPTMSGEEAEESYSGVYGQ